MLYLLLVVSARAAAAVLPLPPTVDGAHYHDGYIVEDSYKDYEDETTKPVNQRVRRYEKDGTIFDPDDEDQVKGALNQIFAGRRFDEPLSPKDFTSYLNAEYTMSLLPITSINDALTLLENWHRTTNLYNPASKFSEAIFEDIYRNATQLYNYFTRHSLKEVQLNRVDDEMPVTRAYLPEQLKPFRLESTESLKIPFRSDVSTVKIPTRSQPTIRLRDQLWRFRTNDVVVTPMQNTDDVTTDRIPTRSRSMDQPKRVRTDDDYIPLKNTDDVTTDKVPTRSKDMGQPGRFRTNYDEDIPMQKTDDITTDEIPTRSSNMGKTEPVRTDDDYIPMQNTDDEKTDKIPTRSTNMDQTERVRTDDDYIPMQNTDDEKTDKIPTRSTNMDQTERVRTDDDYISTHNADDVFVTTDKIPTRSTNMDQFGRFTIHDIHMQITDDVSQRGPASVSGTNREELVRKGDVGGVGGPKVPEPKLPSEVNVPVPAEQIDNIDSANIPEDQIDIDAQKLPSDQLDNVDVPAEQLQVIDVPELPGNKLPNQKIIGKEQEIDEPKSDDTVVLFPKFRNPNKGVAPAPGLALASGDETDLPMCKPWNGSQYYTTAVPTTTVKTTLQFDIEKFLEIVANLTYDYYTNLTAQVNETLQKMSMKPTCPTLSPPPTEFDYTVFNDSLRGKCFVCGMDDRGIPYDANCADAFAGDFIPLVPQNPKAKGQLAKYRKYCAFRDVNNFIINKTMPRMMWGRWTGGCAVRWTDLSGIYTQRTCRSKHKAAVGRHYASKRMAKLEMALSHTDNGCIISPVATLLPLSRGISLFARFHACVCTGSWCNGTIPLTHVASSLLVAMVTSMIFVQ